MVTTSITRLFSWINENLPWVETGRTAGLPPLPYLDHSFDLIFNHSVMTHLDEAYQSAWLAELRRCVLRPGGILTLTVSGRGAFQMFLNTLGPDTPIRTTYAESFHTDGIVYIAQDQWTDDFPDFYHTSFNDVCYIFDHWAKFLDIRCYIPRGALNYQGPDRAPEVMSRCRSIARIQGLYGSAISKHFCACPLDGSGIPARSNELPGVAARAGYASKPILGYSGSMHHDLV